MLEHVFSDDVDDDDASSMSQHFISQNLLKIKSIAEEVQVNPKVLDGLDRGDVRKLLRAFIKLKMIREDCEVVINFQVLQLQTSTNNVR
jgi:hypothetical protein